MRAFLKAIVPIVVCHIALFAEEKTCPKEEFCLKLEEKCLAKELLDRLAQLTETDQNKLIRQHLGSFFSVKSAMRKTKKWNEFYQKKFCD